MSKNLTRKGLAFGALVGLATTLIAGTPAQAANELNLIPTAGTTFDAPVDGAMEVRASLPSGSTGNITQLKWEVSTTNGDIYAESRRVSGDLDNDYVDEARVQKTDSDPQVLDAEAETGSSYYVTQNILAVSLWSPDETADSQTVTVTAFLDSDPDGVYTTGEWKTTVTINFRAYADITTSTTIDKPIENANNVVSYVKYTNLNMEMLKRFEDEDNYVDIGDYPTPGVVVSYADVRDANSNDDWYDSYAAATGFKTTTSSETDGDIDFPLQSGKTVRVQPTLDGDFVGSSVTAAVADATVDSLTLENVLSNTATNSSSDLAEWLTDDWSASYFATDKQFQVKIHGELDHEAVAGVEVKYGISVDPTLSSTVKVAVNGVTYTSNSKLPGYDSGSEVVAGKTDADGNVYLTIQTTGFDGEIYDGSGMPDGITLWAVAQGASSSDFTTYAEDSVYVGYVSNSLDNEFVTTDGAAVNVEVTVKDQFGALADNNKLVVTTDLHGSSQSTTAADDDSNTFQPVVNGKATLSILDNGKGKGLNQYYIILKSKAANGDLNDYYFENRFGCDTGDGWYEGEDCGLYNVRPWDIADIDVNIVDAADTVAGKVAIDGANTKTNADGTYTVDSGNGSSGDDALTLSTEDFFNYNFTDNWAYDEPTYNGDWATINGTVESASTATYAGVAIPNQKVTISGEGMMFLVENGWMQQLNDQPWAYGNGSITTVTEADGSFSFQVNGHLTGAHVVTITSGSFSAKVTVYFAKPLEENATKVTATVGDGSAQFLVGRALDVTFKVTDKYGNPVDLTNNGANTGKLVVTQTGSGYLGVAAGSTTTDGVATAKLITNAGDLGTSTITAKVDFNDSDMTDLSTTTTSEFGVTDADVTVGGRAVYAAVEFAKGKTVTVIVDGKRIYSKLQTSDSYTELKFTQKKAGKHVVTVRVSGGVSVTETVVTTKK